MKKVLLRAPLLTNSGYGVHSRQVFAWLLAESKKFNFQLDVECLNWGQCSWIIEGESNDGLIREIMTRSKPLENMYDITFQLQLPDEWNPSLGKYNVGMTAAVETDRCNPAWIDCCNNMNEIVVPSTFTKNVLRRSGILMKPISVVPEWFNEKIHPNTSPLALNTDTDFNFLIVGMLTGNNNDTDRKNIVGTIQSLCNKFKNDPKVGVIIKTSLGKYSSFDRNRTVKYFESLVAQCRGKNTFPKIHLLYGALSEKEMSELYRSEEVKCYVSLTRAEGYGLPIVDAAASGVPIIATNYSGHLEFLKGQDFLPVDYRLVEIPNQKVDKRIFLEKTRWAEPDTNSFFTRLDDVYNNYSLHKQKALKVQKHVVENFSKEACIKLYNKKFGDILK